MAISWWGFPGSSAGKESACPARDPGSISGSGRSPGEGNSYLLQYSGLENPMDRGAWWAYSPWGCKESDTTERACACVHSHTCTHTMSWWGKDARIQNFTQPGLRLSVFPLQYHLSQRKLKTQKYIKMSTETAPRETFFFWSVEGKSGHDSGSERVPYFCCCFFLFFCCYSSHQAVLKWKHDAGRCQRPGRHRGAEVSRLG